MVEADTVPWPSGYTQSVRVWPPALTCEYVEADATETVAHTIRGLAVVGWTHVAPLVIAVGLLVWAVTASEMPTFTRADRTADGR